MTKKTTEITVGQYTIKMILADWSTRGGYKTRIFISGQGEPDMEQPPYSMIGENPANDKLWRKYNKMEMELQRAVLENGLSRSDLYLEDLTFRFSRKAGCSCPCSPGWVASTAMHNKEGGRIETIFITKNAEQPARTFTMADFDTED